MCDQILLGNATNQEHLQLCSFRTFDGINIWADANHWRLPQFKMSCCTWASFKTLVFVGMLTAKFWAYLNPQSEPQFYNRFLKKLSQCCFLESSRRSAWINQCWCTLLTSLLRKEKAFGRQHQGEPEFYSRVLKKLSQCCFLKSFKKKCMDKSVLMYFANQPASQKEKAFGRQQQGEPEFYS